MMAVPSAVEQLQKSREGLSQGPAQAGWAPASGQCDLIFFCQLRTLRTIEHCDRFHFVGC
jgi:hypothetical protein